MLSNIFKNQGSLENLIFVLKGCLKQLELNLDEWDHFKSFVQSKVAQKQEKFKLPCSGFFMIPNNAKNKKLIDTG